MGLFSKGDPAPREEQITRIVKALRAEDRAARGDIVHDSPDLPRAGAVRMAAERAGTTAEQYEAQRRYNAGWLRDQD